jgi:aerobic C4-dicarboxylate transport protein
MFIAAIKMLIGPTIFCTVVLGIAGTQDMKKVGRVGLKGVVVLPSDDNNPLIIDLMPLIFGDPAVA